MERWVGLVSGAVLASLIVAGSAQAKLKEDVVPNGEAAKAIAKVILANIANDEAVARLSFSSVELKGKTWTVGFTPTDPLAPPKVAGPGEIIVSTDCGFCIVIDISKHDAKVRRILYVR